MAASGFGYGKIAIFGEHAVVHGQPAVVAAIDRGVEVAVEQRDQPGIHLEGGDRNRSWGPLDEPDLHRAALEVVSAVPGLPRGLKLVIRSSLPVRAGLGSSAAFSVALVRGLASLLQADWDQQKVMDLAGLAETLFHGRPSGMDVAAAASGGVLVFQTGVPTRVLTLPAQLMLVVCQVEPSPPTRDLVQRVRQRLESDRKRVEPILLAIGEMARQGAVALEEGRWSMLGALMNENHNQLEKLGVSTPALDRFCQKALAAGARGAKMTGGGGGGSIVAYAPGREQEVLAALRAEGAPLLFTTRVGPVPADGDQDTPESPGTRPGRRHG